MCKGKHFTTAYTVNSFTAGSVNADSVPSISFNLFWVLEHVEWVPCQHGMARPQVADGGDSLQIWRVAANILRKHSRTVDKRWSSSMEAESGANNSSPQKKKNCYEMLKKASELVRFFG
jgi:hypothetical protein